MRSQTCRTHYPRDQRNWQSHPDYPDRNKNRSSGHGSGTAQVEEGVKKTERTGESLQEIIRMKRSRTRHDQSDRDHHGRTIATSSEVSANIGEIARLAAESSNGALESAKACDELSAMAIRSGKNLRPVHPPRCQPEPSAIINFELDDAGISGRGAGRNYEPQCRAGSSL